MGSEEELEEYEGFDIHPHHPHNDDHDHLDNLVSRLSIESFDADAEHSDAKQRLSSDSEEGSCYSLPATPLRRRAPLKDYASDNGGHAAKNKADPAPPRRRRRRSLRSDRWRFQKDQDHDHDSHDHGLGLSGESDHSGVMLIIRPKGGNRALCMGLDEVKACRDLGFELEHERILDTSSGGNSPIANWRISSPGDDPRDVKARLKVWAQAVALVSTTKYAT